MKVYISTASMRSMTGAEAAVELMSKECFEIEFSAGRYMSDAGERIRSLGLVKPQIHNYFPVPEKPFVLNLASFNKDIAERTMNHIRTGIILAADVNAAAFSFHAGFLFDPNPVELGKTIAPRILQSVELAEELFLERLTVLGQFAESLEVVLRVENNVLSGANLRQFGTNPFLFTDSTNIIRMLHQFPKSVSLLLDLAHLKVTCNALQLETEMEAAKLSKLATAFHISDNDGQTDSNHPISIESWFWKYLRNSRAECVTLEVYREASDILRQQKILTETLVNDRNIA